MKLAWNYMTLLKHYQDINNLNHLSGTAFKVLAYIGWKPDNAYINEIIEHPYFKNLSFSTIKRAVLELKEKDLIETTKGSKDSRVVFLKLKK